MSASASGFAGDDGTPRNGGRGGRGGPAGADRGGPPAGGGNAGPDDHHADDLSQEEILDLIVEAMLAAGGPGAEDDDLGDDDGANAGSLAGGCWDVRDAPGPRTPARRMRTGRTAAPRGSAPGSRLMCCGRDPCWPGEADRVHTGALRAVSDDELTGMIKAWRRLSSWATARELSAIAEFARRRPEEDTESDFARHARARRAASGPPQAATQAGSAQTAQTGGAPPAAQAAPADATAGAHPAAQSAPAAPAGGADGASPAVQAAAAAPAGGAHPRLGPPRLLRLRPLAGRTPRVRRQRAAGGGPPQTGFSGGDQRVCLL